MVSKDRIAKRIATTEKIKAPQEMPGERTLRVGVGMMGKADVAEAKTALLAAADVNDAAVPGVADPQHRCRAFYLLLHGEFCALSQRWAEGVPGPARRARIARGIRHGTWGGIGNSVVLVAIVDARRLAHLFILSWER